MKHDLRYDSAMDEHIDTIHLIFKTHLDVGFTDLAGEVVDRYITQFIPQALNVAAELRERGQAERFVWTTGSWLIYEFLERASPAERAQMEQAIAAGDIAWHGLPFTVHSELMDPSLFVVGLDIAHELDQRYGKQTIAAKMTDVPGHTRGIVGLLAQAGIQFLHIGVNPSSTPPDVPSIFVWRDPAGAELLVMYHKGTYGDLMVAPGLRDAIAFAHTGDNQGPQSADQIVEQFAELRARFPGTQVLASTLDAYAQRLLQHKAQFPVLQGEMGDTWIHGGGTDPYKVTAFRELSRIRRRWLEDGTAATHAAAFTQFSRRLLMIPEHTWGLDVKTHLNDWVAYDAQQFRAARPTAPFQKMESSWAEQRGYLEHALAALDGTPSGSKARAALQTLAARAPDLDHAERVGDPSASITTRHFELSFDPTTGALAHLLHTARNRDLAAADHRLGLVQYQTFSAADYERFYRHYNVNKRVTAVWSRPDFTKPGLGNAAESRIWLPVLDGIYRQYEEKAERIIVDLRMPEQASTAYGCPRRFTLELRLPDASPDVEIVLQWFDKPACRMPEATWLSFVPTLAEPNNWRLDKVGQEIDPREVMRDGNRRLHAVGTGMHYRGSDGGFTIETLDAPLVAPGAPSLLNFTNRQPALAGGMHMCLHNNVWGTNFPMWYDDDARFRFVLRVGL